MIKFLPKKVTKIHKNQDKTDDGRTDTCSRHVDAITFSTHTTELEGLVCSYARDRKNSAVKKYWFVMLTTI